MLTDLRCRTAKAKGKSYKLTDAGGLHLHVSVTGHRTWRFKYRYGGKEKAHTLGGYPAIGLKEARDLRDADKRLLKAGRDPATEAKAAALANRLAATDTFEQLAREWYRKQSPAWKPVHAKDVIESLQRDVFGDLGALPVTAINAPMVLATLQKVEARGAIETAHRLRQRISTIFCYGIALSRATYDPAASLVKVLKSTPPARRWPAIVTIKGAAKVLASTDTADATPLVKLASRLLALTAQRPGMIRHMRWDEIHEFRPEHDEPEEDAIWITPAAKMKLELALGDDAAFDHAVPLARAAVDVLRQAWKFSSGSDYVFPGQHSIRKPMSENALSYLLLREGWRGRHVPHGWRSSFSTIMNEWAIMSGGPRDGHIIDLMLAHIPTGLSPSELRYMRAGFLDRRRVLATTWAGMLLDGACPVEEIVTGRRRRKT